MKKHLCLLLSLLLVLSMAAPATNYAEIIQMNSKEPQAWAQSSIDSLYNYQILDNDFFGNYQDNINRVDFIYLAVTAYESITNEEIIVKDSITFLDTEDIYARKAATVGISSGLTKELFGPKVLVSREQLATMMVKTLELAGIKLTSSNSKFSDDSLISSYAKSAIYKASGSKLLNGSNNKVNPKGNATYQEALLIFKNIYDTYVLKEQLDARKNLVQPIFTSIEQFNGVSYVLHWNQTYADYYIVSAIDSKGNKETFSDTDGPIKKCYWDENGSEISGFTPGEEVQFEITAVYNGEKSETYTTDKLTTLPAKISEDNLATTLNLNYKNITVNSTSIPISGFIVKKYTDSTVNVTCVVPLKALDLYMETERLYPEELYNSILAVIEDCHKITGCVVGYSLVCVDLVTSPGTLNLPQNSFTDEFFFTEDGQTVLVFPLLRAVSSVKACISWNETVYLKDK